MKKLFPLALLSSLLLFSGCSEDKKTVVENKTVEPVDVSATEPSDSIVKVEDSKLNTDYSNNMIKDDEFKLNPLPDFKDIEKINVPDQPTEVKIPDIPDIPEPDFTKIETDIDKKIKEMPSLDDIDNSISSVSNPIDLSACVSCHGSKWEKSALNVSRVVKELDSKTIYDSLVGYQDGTYGSNLKAIMKGQLSKYSKDDLVKISQQISK